MLTAGVAVDKATLNFDKPFTYIVPEQFKDNVKIGSIVAVPFGKGDKVRLGIILSLSNSDENLKLKSIIDMQSENIAINSYSLKLISYLKKTTFCTWYEAVKAVIPYGALYKIKNNKLEKTLVRYVEDIYIVNSEFNKDDLKTKKQKDVYDVLAKNSLTFKELVSSIKISKSVLDTMKKSGAIFSKSVEKNSQIYNDVVKIDSNINLNEEQIKVFNDIRHTKDSKPHLIYGVTSSGKSMIFISLIKKAILENKGAILLLPEISLTPQMIILLKSYFGDIVSVIHSKLTPTQRLLEYNKIGNGKTKIVVGTRSAIFAPVENLGYIIIDEEHEKTYKSESAPRYSAIRVAQFISQQTGAKLVLASATPSIESYYLAQKKYYHLHTLKKRYNNMPMPEIEIIDMSQQALTGDIAPVSRVIIKYIADNILQEKQSIVLINRRGYSTTAVCKDCKTALQCDDCSVNLVYHKKDNRLSCHYCGKNYEVKKVCPHCGGVIEYVGYGTQHIQEYIQQCIPNAKILRMDTDTTISNNSHQEMLEAFKKKEYDILIGTQMVAKGLDFKDVNLVCVLGIDSALNQSTYNGNEHAFNLITQVIGRAGRQEIGAKAVIQTFDSDNNIIKLAQKSDYETFYNQEISYRQLNVYPPYCTICTVAFTSNNDMQCAKDARNFLNILKDTVTQFDKQPLTILGPVPFNINMVNKTYRWRLNIKCKNNENFRNFLNNAIDFYLKDKNNKSAIYINLNPIQD